MVDIKDFKNITPSDRDIIYPYLMDNKFQCCEFSFNNLVIWGDSYQIKWMIYKKRLILYLGVFGYAYMPLGEPFTAEELKAISDSILSQGGSGSLINFAKEYISEIINVEEYFTVESNMDSADYLYSTEKLFNLSGKKLSKKRNLIRQFEKIYPDYKSEMLTKKLMEDCVRLTEMFKVGTSSSLDAEKIAFSNAERHFDDLKCEGIVLSVNDQVVAFSFFSQVNRDTYCINFEKSLYEFKGASQMINFKTAEYLLDKCKYINREQDLGIPGLRKAKLSYSPEELLVPLTLEPK